ncbi:MAG: hypothetical protein ACRD1Z_18620 [Vicinamibacteria bacterium]
MSPTTELIWHSANFVLVIGVIIYFGRAQVRGFLQSRKRSIAGAIAEAEKSREAAEKVVALWRAKLGHAEEETAVLLSQWQRMGEEDAREIVARAHGAAERMRQDASAAAEAESAAAQARLRRETADRALKGAEEIVKSQLNSSDHERLFSDYLARLDEMER